MRRVLSVVTASVVATAVLAYPASAEGGWSAPQRLANDQVQAEFLHVASNGSGDVFATYWANGIGSFTRRPSGTWNRWSESTGGAEGVDEGAVVDNDGNVTVAYPADGHCGEYWDDEMGDHGVEDADFHIAAAFRPYGKEWRQFRLPGQWAGCEQSTPALGVDARGTVTAIWSGGGSLYASQRRLGKRWTAPLRLGPARVGEFDVVVTPEGIATAVWAATSSIRSATSRTFGRWGNDRKVAYIPDRIGLSRAEHLTVASTGPRSLLAGWSDFTLRNDRFESRVRFATADDRGRWRTPRTVKLVSNTSVRVGSVVTAAKEGNAVLAWHLIDGEKAVGPLRIRVRTRGRWSRAALVDRRAAAFGANGLAVTDAGVVLVWIGGDPGRHFPLAATRRWVGAWGTPQRLASRGFSSPDARVVPWAVTWKPGVVTAAFPGESELSYSDLRFRRAR